MIQKDIVGMTGKTEASAGDAGQRPGHGGRVGRPMGMDQLRIEFGQPTHLLQAPRQRHQRLQQDGGRAPHIGNNCSEARQRHQRMTHDGRQRGDHAAQPQLGIVRACGQGLGIDLHQLFRWRFQRQDADIHAIGDQRLDFAHDERFRPARKQRNDIQDTFNGRLVRHCSVFSNRATGHRWPSRLPR